MLSLFQGGNQHTPMGSLDADEHGEVSTQSSIFLIFAMVVSQASSCRSPILSSSSMASAGTRFAEVLLRQPKRHEVRCYSHSHGKATQEGFSAPTATAPHSSDRRARPPTDIDDDSAVV
jgi:hypothetical protein